MVKRFEELKTGDTFAWKIESVKHPEFNGRYLILTYYFNERFEVEKSKLFRAKITKNDEIPCSEQELDQMENIILRYNIYDFAIEEYEEAKNTKPDSYGYIYQYTFSIYIDRKTLPKKMRYLGNFSLKDIPNEFYVPNGTRDQGSAYWTYFEDNLLHGYILYNQKQFIGYTKEGNKEVYEYELDFENFRKQLKKLGDAIDGPNGKEVLKKMGIDIENEIPKEDSLTYVGPDNEESAKKKS